MTVIFDSGDFWIDVVEPSLTLPDAAGEVISTSVNLAKSGHMVGYAISVKNTSGLIIDNSEIMSPPRIRINGGGTGYTYGAQVTSVSAAVQKTVGVAGNVTVVFVAVCYMRN